MKKLFIIAIVAIVTFSCLVCGCAGTSDVFSSLINDEETAENITISQRTTLEPSTTPVKKVSELYIPDGLRENECGLFFYGRNGTLTKSTDANVNYDPNKPLVIYFHGNAWDYGYYTSEKLYMEFLDTEEENWLSNYWLDRGFNVAIYYWSQFADEVVLSSTGCGYKIWGTENGPKMRWAYANANGGRAVEEDDMPNCCLAEMFGSYYVDILDRLGFNGSEIRFTGHSMGAQFAVAASSYITTKALGGVINSRYIPDRVTLYDGYFEALPSEDCYCDWLNRSIGADGTIGLCKEIIVELKTLGVAVEQITTTGQTMASAAIFGKQDLCQSLYDEVMVVNYSSLYLSTVSSQHEVSKKWYSYLNSLPQTLDNSDPLGKALAVSPKTPTAYVYARMGVAYDMNDNYNFKGEDDIQYSTAINSAKVAGFAFFDANGNGVNDDGIFNRLAGVKATLFVDGQAVASATTAVSGYYCFDLGSEYYGKTASVVFTINKSYDFTCIGDGEKYSMATNDADTNGTTATFTIDNQYTLAIKNVGLVKK